MKPTEADIDRARRGPSRPDKVTFPDEPGASGSGGEVEFKLTVPDAASRQVLARLARCGPLTTTLLHAHYHDTDDDRLAAAGLSLRLRQENGHWRQTLKQSRRDGSHLCRSEHEVDLSTEAAATPALDLWLHAGTPPGRALFAALGIAPEATERPTLPRRYSTRVVRESVTLERGHSRIEVAFDQGHIEAGVHSVPLNEVEIELKRGHLADLLHVTRRWLGEGLYVQAESKAERGLRLLHGVPTPPPTKAGPPGALGNTTPDGFARAVVASCLAQILPNTSVLASGSADDDHVHQLRIGLRRLRTALRELAALSDELPVAIERPLAKVFRQLGAHRDQETVLAAIRPRLMAAGAQGVRWAEAAPHAEVDLARLVKGRRFQRALLCAMAFAQGTPPKDRPARTRRTRGEVEARLQRLRRQIRDGAQRFTTLPEAGQHQVRKRLKRLRYLSEFVAPLYQPEAVQHYLDALKPAQDALGRHNDNAVARAWARRAPKHDPDARFAVKWLDKEAARTACKSRKKLRKLREAPRFWKA